MTFGYSQGGPGGPFGLEHPEAQFWQLGNFSKLSHTYCVTYQNLCKKGTKSIEKELSQLGLSVLRKNPKHCPKSPENGKNGFSGDFGQFWDFFSKLVGPIDLILSL